MANSTSTSQEPLIHRELLEDAAALDFVDTDTSAFRQFEDQFKEHKSDYDELLHTLAKRGPAAFDGCKGDDVLRWILRLKDGCSLLHVKTKVGHRTTPIHTAISSKNHGFLDCILSIAEKSVKENSDLYVEIVAALRARNQIFGNYTCLHASIMEKLPCVEKIVELCAQAETHAEVRLTGTIKTRNITQQWKKQEKEKQEPKIEPIFLMRDSLNNTALHLLMETNSKPWPARSRRHAPGDEGSTSNDYSPLGVIRTLEKSLGPSMGDLWEAINDDGLSPYQKRLEVSEPGRTDAKFQNALRNMILNSLTEIPKLKRALYGTKGTDGFIVVDRAHANVPGVIRARQVSRYLCFWYFLVLDADRMTSEKELCLDMSDFNQSSHDFKIFVDQLKSSKDKSLLFEECLLSVYLPDLNTFKKATPHDGVRDLFNWLHDPGSVKRIKSLNIPDSTTLPMSDELVSEAIFDVFEIEKLDWRKLDINLDILVDTKHSGEFTELTLYSTGNYSVLYHWISPHGLEQLTGLRKVTIDIMKLDESHHCGDAQKRHTKQVTKYYEKLDTSLKALAEKKKKQNPPIDFEYKINTDVKWDFPVLQYTEQTLEEKLELLTKLEACRKFLGQMRSNRDYSVFDSRFQLLRPNPAVGDNRRVIKVAVIDNGADKFRQKIRDAIAKGVSYVKADAESAYRILPWWMVSDPHGTQMASLVVNANPWCRLYIARVGKSRKDILPEDAAQAIDWAIDQQVDIISISWITKSEFPELKKAIEKATKHALVFCSTADEGAWSDRVYPACHDGTVRVSATDRYGNLMPTSDKDAINIPVPGQNIPAFGPSYMGAGIAMGTVSGSSVATALAAGIASLALLLLQVFNDADREKLVQEGFYNNKKIVRVLSRLADTENHPSLFPTRPSELAELPKRWDLSEFA